MPIKILHRYICSLIDVPRSCSPAQALVQRAFVASTGNDSNTTADCQVNTPCRTYSAAVTVVNPNGEVVAIDFGQLWQYHDHPVCFLDGRPRHLCWHVRLSRTYRNNNCHSRRKCCAARPDHQWTRRALRNFNDQWRQAFNRKLCHF